MLAPDRLPAWRKAVNSPLHLLARFLPSSGMRVFFHRLRGTKIGKGVFIGEEVFIDNNYPQCVEIGNLVQIGVRTVIFAHLRGPGRVIIEDEVYVGPGCVIAAAHGRTVRIGAGAVICALSAVTADVPPHAFVKSASPEYSGTARQPLATADSYTDFLRGLTPNRAKKADEARAPRDRNAPPDAGDAIK